MSKGHPWYGKSTDEISSNVHGGITFAEQSEEFEDCWTVGFDTCHYGDNQSNRNLSFVMIQLSLLVEDAINARS